MRHEVQITSFLNVKNFSEEPCRIQDGALLHFTTFVSMTMSSSPFLGVVPKTPISIGMTFIYLFHIFLNYLANP